MVMLLIAVNCVSIHSLVIKCTFDIFNFGHTHLDNHRYEEPAQRYYRCLLRNLTIKNTDLEIKIDKTGYYNRENLKDMVWIEYSEMKLVPSVIFNEFPNLDYFVMVDSKVQSIERSSFRNAYNLKKLTFDKVYMPWVGPLWFADITSLEYLSLINCDINRIETHAFQELDFLRGLYLNGNRMIVLEEHILQPLVNLEQLSLNDNRLKVLVGNLFVNNTKLKIASFRGNKIFVVDSNMFSHNHDLKFVDFRENSCIDKQFDITNGYLDDLNKSLNSCSETMHLYILLIPFFLLIICLIAYSYHLAVVKKVKIFNRAH